MVQFIEIHGLLGAELFYFYNASISAGLSKVLDGYVQEGLVRVIQWNSFYPSKVFYNNQGIMQIDCLYRNMFKVKGARSWLLVQLTDFIVQTRGFR